jgi:acyl-CoA thioester hydrolase
MNQPSTFTPEFRFFIHIDVRFGDLDPYNHVNNAMFFTYMEQARVRYLQHLNLVETASDLGIIIAEASCTYKRPIVFGQNIICRIRASNLKNSSFVFEYSLDDADYDRVMAIGRTVQVCYDYDAGKPVPIPTAWRARIEQFERAV